MVEGTCSKQVEAKLETMELGLQQTQEELNHCWEDITATREVVYSREKEVANLGQRVDGLLKMFSKMSQVSMPENFPPKTVSEPIMTRVNTQKQP